jgi:NAD(P)-dependent dehydrogenase (short-subunit alcohol dehydrogenase family)
VSSADDARAVVVTGGASGIGAAVAERFASAGASVVIGDIDARRGSERAQALGARFERADVSKVADVERLIAVATEPKGHVDVLVNCAGTIVTKSALDTTEDEWDTVLAVNLKGAWMCSRAALRVMRPDTDATIVNVASTAGLVGLPNVAAYGASKGGMISLTKAMAVECAPSRIRVNAVCPGQIRTPMAERFFAGQSNAADFGEAFVAEHPLGRMGEPGEVADAVMFLAGTKARFITGVALEIDGGYCAR